MWADLLEARLRSAANSSVTIPGSREPRRIRVIPSTSCTASNQLQSGLVPLDPRRRNLNGYRSAPPPDSRFLPACSLHSAHPCHCPASHPSSRKRNNTVCAELIAAILYLDIRPCTCSAVRLIWRFSYSFV